MMKYIKYLFALVLLCSQVTAADKAEQAGGEQKEASAIRMTVVDGVTKVNAQAGRLTARSIQTGDAHLVEAITGRCLFKEGLTQNPEDNHLAIYEMAKNLITRQETAKNPYSGLVFSIADEPYAFLTMGVMSALGFGEGYFFEKHPFVIETFHKMGAIKQKEQAVENRRVAADAYDKVDDCGLIMIVPAFPRDGKGGLNQDQIRAALRIGVDVAQILKNGGMRLPRGENTLPGYVMGLFDPQDPLIQNRDLEAVGFSFIADKGLEQFYNKPRILAYVKLK